MVLESQNQSGKKRQHEPTRINRFGDISQVSTVGFDTPLDSIHQEGVLTLEQRLEAIIAWSQSHFGLDEFKLARKEFQFLTGRVFHDDPFYDQRMSYFLDYFVFQRPVSKEKNSATPYHVFLQSQFLKERDIHPHKLEQLKELTSFVHSLFSIKRKKKSSMVVKNLFNNEVIELFDGFNQSLAGFSSGSVIQGFTFNLAGKYILSNGILLHPKSVTRTISKIVRNHIKSNNSSNIKILSSLAKKNLNIQRHRHIEDKKIYLSH